MRSQSPAEPTSWILIGWPRSTLSNWQRGRPTHLMLITELLNIQFHRQFLITYSGSGLVNVLLWLFDISSQKRNGKEKNRFLLIKNKKKKMLRNIKHSVHWVSTPPSKSLTHSFSPSPPLNQQTVQTPFLGNPSPYILVFCKHLPKSRIFQWISKILKFFILSTISSFKSN